MPVEKINWKLSDLDIADLDLTDKDDLDVFEGYLADCISNETGYCIFGFDYKLNSDSVDIFDIEYDLNED